MTLFESIPDVEKPKRDRTVGSPTSSPEVKHYKPSQPEEGTDLAAGKGAGPSAQGNSFPAQLPENVGWGDDQDDSLEEGGIDETGEQKKPAASGNESAGVLDVQKAHPALFDQGQVLYSEFCNRGLLPKASSLCVDDINSYQLSPTYVLPETCPEWLITTQRPLSRAQVIELTGVFDNNYSNHARVQDKYKTASLIGKTAREQAEMNSELRSAVRSHIETWQWKSGGIKLHL